MLSSYKVRYMLKIPIRLFKVLCALRIEETYKYVSVNLLGFGEAT